MFFQSVPTLAGVWARVTQCAGTLFAARECVRPAMERIAEAAAPWCEAARPVVEPAIRAVLRHPMTVRLTDYCEILCPRKAVTAEIDLAIFQGMTGSYAEVVKADSSMHRAAAAVMVEVMSAHFLRQRPAGMIEVMDIASGATPVSVDAVFKAMRSHRDWNRLDFHYSALDLTPAQISDLRRFSFASNVTVGGLRTGDAWDRDMLHAMGINRFDWVTSNLHIHHGTPRQIYDFACAVRDMLKPGGIWTSHVVVMPDEAVYISRPGQELHDGADVAVPGLRIPVADLTQPHVANWREEFLAAYEHYLIDKGVPRHDAQAVLDHIRQSDYPLSLDLLRQVFKQAELEVEVYPFRKHSQYSTHPLAKFFGVIVARKITAMHKASSLR